MLDIFRISQNCLCGMVAKHNVDFATRRTYYSCLWVIPSLSFVVITGRKIINYVVNFDSDLIKVFRFHMYMFLVCNYSVFIC